MTRIVLPELSLVLLVGPSGAGKSTFAAKHFRRTEVLSSDFFRGLVSDDETDQNATKDAFESLHFVAGKRLAAGKLTVIDATNVRPEDRKTLLDLARQYHTLSTAIVFQLPVAVCLQRNTQRPDRNFGPHVIPQQNQALRRSLKGLRREGFRQVYLLDSQAEVDAVEIQRQPLWTDLRGETGPFDLIGDIHGCREELDLLLAKLGYADSEGAWRHPAGRKAVFVGDLVDRGPDTPGVLRRVMGMVRAGTALCVTGNHDAKLLKKLRGKEVRLTHGLAESMEQLGREPPEFLKEVIPFLDGLLSHYVLDGGRLVVAHAGLKQELQGRASGRVRDFAMYGETTGETDEYGLPVRYDWAAEYRGPAQVVYGHTPVPVAEWLNRTINLDTGCVFGGRLTALRYPEKVLVDVPALAVHYQPVKPLAVANPAAQRPDDLLDLQDVLGKRVVPTRLLGNMTIREENSVAALEVMSRFAVDPRWLIYLPPTMSPCQTSLLPGLLEHPDEAFGYYDHEGVQHLVCQEKHMGSRVVLVVCKDAASAARRFGVRDGSAGVCLTRTGRPFFADANLEAQLLERVRSALDKSGLWEELKTDWVCLDAELMPWSAKAQELLRQQYAAVGVAGRMALSQVNAVLAQAAGRLPEAAAHLQKWSRRETDLHGFTEAYRRYCWPVDGLQDLRLAPFHLLASEGAVHTDRDHQAQIELLGRLCEADPILKHTRTIGVDLSDPASRQAATDWWLQLTAQGGEGMVVKPLLFVVKGRKGLAQPAVKCRGPEYLRLIYGPTYTEPENLERLRKRGLGGKRSLALREFALGIEALERFVAKEPLYKVHECVFGVLALESEPVDPRL